MHKHINFPKNYVVQTGPAKLPEAKLNQILRLKSKISFHSLIKNEKYLIV